VTILQRIWRWGSGLPQADIIENFSRLLIGDVNGNLLTELEVMVPTVSWRLNEPSSINFTIARTDPKATETNLRFGNRVYIEFDNGLPPWGGVIDPPRTWNTDNSITVTCYSGEYILGWRQTAQEQIYADFYAGGIFRDLIIKANAIKPTGVILGETWEGGESLSPEYHFTNVLKILRDQLVKDYTPNDYYIEPSLSNGKIVFTANYLESRGRDLPQVVLIEGHNIADVKMVEQGPIINSWDIAGSGNSWDDNRAIGHAEDETSIGLYGLRQSSEIYSESPEQATVDAIAVSRLNGGESPGTKDVRRMIAVDVVDLAPARFGAYDIGDRIEIVLERYGFGGFAGTVRVMGRDYQAYDGFCSLIVEKV